MFNGCFLLQLKKGTTSQVITMLIKTCSHCQFHEVKKEEEAQISYCRKENCWAELTDCITKKAVERFLKEEHESPISGSFLK